MDIIINSSSSSSNKLRWFTEEENPRTTKRTSTCKSEFRYLILLFSSFLFLSCSKLFSSFRASRKHSDSGRPRASRVSLVDPNKRVSWNRSLSTRFACSFYSLSNFFFSIFLEMIHLLDFLSLSPLSFRV